MISRRTPRPPRLPRIIRRVERRLRGIHHRPERRLDLSELRRELAVRVAALAPEQRGPAAVEVLDAYVDTYISDWLSGMRGRHSAVLNEIDLLEVHVSRAREMLLALHEDQSARLADLEGAVSHALERVTDPDAPSYEPVPRQRRGGGRP